MRGEGEGSVCVRGEGEVSVCVRGEGEVSVRDGSIMPMARHASSKSVLIEEQLVTFLRFSAHAKAIGHLILNYSPCLRYLVRCEDVSNLWICSFEVVGIGNHPVKVLPEPDISNDPLSVEQLL